MTELILIVAMAIFAAYLTRLHNHTARLLVRARAVDHIITRLGECGTDDEEYWELHNELRNWGEGRGV